MNILTQIHKLYPTQDECLKYLEKIRWNGEPVCPYCRSTNITSIPEKKRHHCNSCNTSFSVTVGTIFHKAKVDLQKWFAVIFLISNYKDNISLRQLAKAMKINKNTAWLMSMRIRKAMAEQDKLLKIIGNFKINQQYEQRK